MRDAIKQAELERDERWTYWIKRIPAIKFKGSWEVKVIPPFAGAMARFWIDEGEAHVSVYLDVDDSLGCVGEPYWEVYPIDGDTFRCFLHETKELIDAIGRAG